MNYDPTLLRGKRKPTKSAPERKRLRAETEPTEDRPYARKGPAGGYGLHDGGVVVGITDIPTDTDWAAVKQCLTDALSIGEDAVVYTTSVFSGECCALLKPFPDDLATCKRLTIPIGTVRVLDGLELAAAVRIFPPHIQRLRETRACAQSRHFLLV